MLKSVNLENIYAGSLDQWDKHFVNQASDVPSIILFLKFVFSKKAAKIDNIFTLDLTFST